MKLFLFYNQRKNFLQKERFFMLGFSLWKRHFIKPFFKAKDNKIIF
ncbi:capsular polysaccharide biosynthesis protein, partial [Campylobacter jejuni]|nr:capsular polysaccharide biosynthesis protein [Campylobacter jejuni]ECP7059272.1 capsular polysaccharide biosynthesis protein [Campylobacter jejuni]